MVPAHTPGFPEANLAAILDLAATLQRDGIATGPLKYALRIVAGTVNGGQWTHQANWHVSAMDRGLARRDPCQKCIFLLSARGWQLSARGWAGNRCDHMCCHHATTEDQPAKMSIHMSLHICMHVCTHARTYFLMITYPHAGLCRCLCLSTDMSLLMSAHMIIPGMPAGAHPTHRPGIAKMPKWDGV